MVQLFRESFVPVLLVISGIFLLVVYSHYVADLDADQVTVIEIPATSESTAEDENLLVDEESFVQVEKQRTDDPLFRKAYQLIRQQQWNQAEQLYRELIKQHDNSQARTDLGFISYKLGNYNAAEREFSLALEQHPVFVAAYFYRAKNYRRLKQFDKAEADYRAYLNYYPQHFFAHFNMGLLQFNQQQWPGAIESFDKAAQLAPGRKKSKAFVFLGKTYQKLGAGYVEKAEQAYQKAIRVYPGNIKPRMGLASLLPDTAQGREQAREIYQQVLQLKPNLAQAYFLLAMGYAKDQSINEAKLNYRQAIEYNPAYSAARYNLGLILLNQQLWQEAADQFQSIVQLNPQHARAHFNLGRANYRLKRYEPAIKNYHRALDIMQGNYPEVLSNLGLIYSAQKDYDKAIEIYKSALKANKNSAKLHYNLGVVYSKSKRYKLAQQSFIDALSLKQDYAQVWYNLGLIHARNEQHIQAIAAYQKALAIKADYRSAQLNLAVSYNRTKRPDQAEKVYRQVLHYHPRYVAAWINLGLVLLEQKKYAQAEDVFSQAVELDTESVRVIALLAKSQARQDQLEAAASNYRKALDMQPESRKYRLAYVRVLKRQGDYSLAMQEVNKALKLYPKSKKLKREHNQIQSYLNKASGKKQ